MSDSPTRRMLMPEGPAWALESEQRFRDAAAALRLKLRLVADGRRVVLCRRGGYLWAWGRERWAWCFARRMRTGNEMPEDPHGRSHRLFVQPHLWRPDRPDGVLVDQGAYQYSFAPGDLARVAELAGAQRRPRVNATAAEAGAARLASWRLGAKAQSTSQESHDGTDVRADPAEAGLGNGPVGGEVPQ